MIEFSLFHTTIINWFTYFKWAHKVRSFSCSAFQIFLHYGDIVSNRSSISYDAPLLLKIYCVCFLSHQLYVSILVIWRRFCVFFDWLTFMNHDSSYFFSSSFFSFLFPFLFLCSAIFVWMIQWRQMMVRTLDDLGETFIGHANETDISFDFFPRFIFSRSKFFICTQQKVNILKWKSILIKNSE